MYMLDSLVGAACSPGAQGRRNSLACNCLEGLLSLADARGMQPLPQTPAPASAPSSPAAPAGNSVTGAPSTASDVPSTCTSSSSTQPSCVSPWAGTCMYILCIYACICMYIYMHICMYVYMYILPSPLVCLRGLVYIYI